MFIEEQDGVDALASRIEFSDEEGLTKGLKTERGLSRAREIVLRAMDEVCAELANDLIRENETEAALDLVIELAVDRLSQYKLDRGQTREDARGEALEDVYEAASAAVRDGLLKCSINSALTESGERVYFKAKGSGTSQNSELACIAEVQPVNIDDKNESHLIEFKMAFFINIVDMVEESRAVAEGECFPDPDDFVDEAIASASSGEVASFSPTTKTAV